MIPMIASSGTPTPRRNAKKGFIHVPASGAHGGVIATGGVRRDATLHLAALRLLSAGDDATGSLTLRRYVLGLALVAFTAPIANYLRQGCNLVPNPNRKRELSRVNADGTREPADVSHGQALEFALAAAGAFKVGQSRQVTFETERAKEELSEADTRPKTSKTKKKASTVQ